MNATQADDLVSEYGLAELRRMYPPRVVKFGPSRPAPPHIMAALDAVDRALGGTRSAPFPPQYPSLWTDPTPQEIEDELEARAVTDEFDRTFSI